MQKPLEQCLYAGNGMKIFLYLFIVSYNLCLVSPAFSQNSSEYQLFLRNGTITPEKNISDETTGKFNLRTAAGEQKSLVVIQFEKIPDDAEKAQLKLEGIELLDYIPNNAYLATIQNAVKNTTLVKNSARSIITLSPEQKMHPDLSTGAFPAHAEKVEGMLDVWISFPKSFTYEEVKEELTAQQFEITSDVYKNYEILELRVAKNRLSELASLSVVKYIEAVPGENKNFNDKSEANSRANILNSFSPAGYKLQGNGVVVGVGDDSNPSRHVDLKDKVINRAAIKGGSHGMHVMGTIAGSGIIAERYKGYAPKATLVTQYFSNIFTNATNYVKDFGMVITNNSYGVSPSSCSDFGEYTLYSYILDQQAFELPYLQHVFSAGNSGATSIVCSNGLGTVLSGYQSAKNVITVGNTTALGIRASTSSFGPVKDGRTKPEVMAQGSLIASTIPTDLYGSSSGTSMAAPAVSGGLALLYEFYRKENQGANPKSGLMKALICNGSYDQALTGPDYSYGFGWLNLNRSMNMLDNLNYFIGSLSNNTTKTHTINVPANTARLKIMLYWNDPGSSVLTGKTLINNLDLSVTPPGTNPSAVLPRRHNTTDKSSGVDDLNNIEQVIVDSPIAGNYTISVRGKSVPQGPQEYFIVYDTIRVSTKLTFPIGGERLVNGDQLLINWESYGNTTSPFKVEFSTNNGNDWATLASSVDPGVRQLEWTVPDEITDQARIRVTQISTGVVSVSLPFTILGSPIASFSPVQCEGYISIDWTTVPGATDYEVLLLKGGQMEPVGTTTSTSYTLGGLSRDSTYYVSVRARLNDNPGRYARSLSRIPNNGTCSGSISDNDLKLDAIISPAGSGRKGTGTEFTASSQITIRIKNLDDEISTQEIEVGYSIGADGSTIIRHNISPAIPAGGYVDYTFPETANLAATGSYRLKVFVKKDGDPIANNDTQIKFFRQLENPLVTIPFSDLVESLENQEINSETTGLKGGDRYDFARSTAIGRLRTFVNTGMAFSGTKAFTLDVSRYDAAGNSNFLIGTFNMSSYNPSSHNISLSFRYKNYGQSDHPDNRVWIRGSDSDPWIEIYKLFENQNQTTDEYKFTGSIAVSDTLRKKGQLFTSSFQVKWGQWGDMITADNLSGGGYSFDDIRLFSETNDVQLVSIDNPGKVSCGFSSSEKITATVRNSAPNAISSIPIKMQIDGGTVISETISSIAAGASIQYKFNTTAGQLSLGQHTIKIWVSLSSDSNPNNNTQEQPFYNTQVISSFPYLENFENGNGSWRTEGVNSSWAYGTPASTKINRAASGTKAWKTSLTGNYNDRETSYLYSPCFRINTLTNPALSFSTAMDLEDCADEVCDVAFVEYSTDGTNWIRLGTKDAGTNWYDEINNNQGTWSVADNTRWHVSTILIPKGFQDMRFRFVLQTDTGLVREGIAIDDIHVYDLQNPIFSGSGSSQAITRSSVSGTNWVHFTDNNSRIVASILPDQNNLGTTEVQALIHQSAVRNYEGQYYLNRSFTIKPQNNNFTKNSTVRLYFEHNEFENLFHANGCNGCTSPTTAFDLAVSKYSNADRSLEDGSLANDTNVGWSFFASSDVVKVPYDNGYYAEFKLQSFSEFWLAKNAIQVKVTPLPVDLVTFTAKRNKTADAPAGVLLEWKTSSEKQFSHFEIEVAVGETAVRTNNFLVIGKVDGKGDVQKKSEYSFMDISTSGLSTRYYRLKVVDNDGSFRHSLIRSIGLDEVVSWRVFPNPSRDIFNLELQAGQYQDAVVNIVDPKGQVLKSTTVSRKDQNQTITVSLPPDLYPPGLYLLEVTRGPEKQVFKIFRN